MSGGHDEAVQSRVTDDQHEIPLPERVRRDTERVAAHARWVHRNDEGVRRLAQRLASEPTRPIEPDPWTIAAGTPGESAAATVLTLAAVNFGSGWNPVLRKRPGTSGATTVAAGVRAWWDERGGEAESLVGLSGRDLAAACGQPTPSLEVMQLMDLLAEALGQLGRWITDEHDGSFLAAVEAASSAAELAASLAELPFFADAPVYDRRPVALYKRAQLAAADCHRSLPDHRPRQWTDIGRLTAFADNLVPHVLRIEGALTVEPALVSRIDAGELIASGSAEEVELRAVGVATVERLVAELEELGHRTTPAALDARLWRRGRQHRFKASPRHRTRCVYY